MTNDPQPVSESELHAFADGQLAEGDIARVQAWLQVHPEDKARVLGWRKQNEDIRQMFADYGRPQEADAALLYPAPTARPAWRRVLVQAAAAIVIFSAGGVTGALVAPEQPAVPAPQLTLSAQASDAYLIYASEVRHPVEVYADEKDHLVAWLGKRLGHKLSAPDLTAQGYKLVGGRLVPVDGAPGAMLMYEDANGKRLTMLLGHAAAGGDTAFLFSSDGPVETFYWIDNRLAYAVSAEIPRDKLKEIAEACYRQFQA